MSQYITLMFPYCYRGPRKQETVDKLTNIAASSFLTGSRAFGLESDNSDYDYVVPYNEVKDYIYLRNLKHYARHSKLPTLCLSLNTFCVDSCKQAIGNDDPTLLEIESFRSRYVKLPKPVQVIQLLVVQNEDEYNGWLAATQDMIDLCEESPLFKFLAKKKSFRVAVFELLRERYGLGDRV